ncbi:MAG: DJ-1/PfpI family protein [Fimbriimonadaceae bacterium]
MNAGFVIFDQAEELDFVGPWEMFTMWAKVASGPQCHMVAQAMEPVVCAKGMSVNPSVDFEHCPPLDYLIVPGGQGTRIEVDNPVLIEFIAKQASGCKAVLSVCTGSFLLHAGGLLSGKRATTHWGSLDRLRALGTVEVVEERVVRDFNIWTGAGVSAGIDLALAFIAHEVGDDVAGQVQLAAEYYPSSRSYGGSQNNPRAPGHIRGL